MSDFEDLKQNILNHAPIQHVSATGFHTLKCPVCGDHTERAGFRFEDNQIGYNCFRGVCDANVLYIEGEPISKKFRHLMDVIGVEIPPGLRLNSKKQKAVEVLNEDLYKEIHYTDLEISDKFEAYDPREYPEIKAYLRHRGVPNFVDFFVRDKKTMVIPFFYYGKLIGWQKHKIWTQYYEKSSGNSSMIYLPTGKIPQNPIIVEGVFDALSLPNAIAIMGNRVTKEHAFVLRNFKPILLPDKKDSRFLEAVKKYKWRLCLPNWGKYKDANEVLEQHGKYVLAYLIGKGIIEESKYVEQQFKLWQTKRRR
jgi:hypothetical protein